MEIKDKELHRIVTTTLVYKTDPSAIAPAYLYLITKRALTKKVKPGKWTIPGGGLSVDDYINSTPTTSVDIAWYGVLEKVIRRETREEVNLEIGTPQLLIDMTMVRPDAIPVLILSYYAPYVSGNVVLNDEATDFAWVTVEQAKNYDLIDGVWDEIRQVDEMLKSK